MSLSNLLLITGRGKWEGKRTVYVRRLMRFNYYFCLDFKFNIYLHVNCMISFIHTHTHTWENSLLLLSIYNNLLFYFIFKEQSETVLRLFLLWWVRFTFSPLFAMVSISNLRSLRDWIVAIFSYGGFLFTEAGTLFYTF